MPSIAKFYGVKVYLYFVDGERRHLPHLHVNHNDQNAVLAIKTGRLLQGRLKAGKLKLVQAWMELHREELLKAWELARGGKTTFKIKPLR